MLGSGALAYRKLRATVLFVFSTSPEPSDPSHANHVSVNANMWHVSGDFWDQWGDTHRSGLDHQFDLLAKWQGVGGPGHWPDVDMIPHGHIGIKCTIAGPDRQTRFTKVSIEDGSLSSAPEPVREPA